jgi:dihydrofolate synthase/folylpolyglutamate synthase
MNLLGDTLPKIAFEKAGIIKKEVTVVISETQDSIKEVFVQKSKSESSSIVFADKKYEVVGEGYGKFQVTDDKVTSTYELDLKGIYQQKNLAGVLATLDELKNLGFKIPDEATEKGLSNTTTLTGLKGRWQKLKDNPLTICDTGHNEAGVIEILKQIKAQKFEKLFMVWGMVNDKDVSKILSILPSSAYYFFCQANIPRAMDANELFLKAKAAGLRGEVILNVNNAICQANERATQKDMIFIGGSTFVVAEIENL